MKEKNYGLKSKENVIFFPGMINKLINDGLAFAEENNYVEAAKCFDEAKKYEELDDMILSVYILTLLETKRQQEAKEICEKLMKKKSPMLEQIVELYLTILLDLKDYNEIDTVLNKLLVDKRFSKERKKNFLQLKELSGKLAMEQESLLEKDSSYTSDIELEKFKLDVFTKLRLEEQEQLLQDSFFQDVTEAIPNIIQIAESNKVYPAVQSLALLVLGAIGETTEVLIEKFGFKEKINPVMPPAPNSVDRIDSINNCVHKFSEKNPSEFEMTIGLVRSHAYSLFPFDWTGYSDEEVAEGYINYVETLLGKENEQPNELYDFIKILDESTAIIDND
jgi:tetratricopeptide (TPR) repeat protein